MGEVAVIIGSSLHLSSTSTPSLPKPWIKKPSPSPNLPKYSPHRSPPKPLLTDVRRHLTPPHHQSSTTRHLLKYYARLASKLAQNGRLHDFLMLAESILASDALAASRTDFVARINIKLVSRGISDTLRGGNLEEVLDFMSGAEKLGICPSSLFDESAVQALSAECRGLVDGGRLEELVVLMETLAGYRFFVKHIIDPDNILKMFVEKRDPNMAVRFASVFPHSQLLFCSIIQEFGKKQDITSAMNAFEAFKQKCGGFNMFACRSIIDICGLCGDSLRSRIIFEELLAQKITPNTYVFNSLMNVNAHDLSYILHVYTLMQNLGVNVDMSSYNILLKACCIAKRVDLAQEIYKEVKHMESKGALELDVITYSTMIKVFADAKEWQMAMNIKEDMILADVSPNIVTWSSLISACANAGLVDRAIQMFDEMLLAGCEPNAQCCNVLLYACVESCQYDRAFRLFYTWKETGFKVYHNTKDRGYDGTEVSLTAEHTAENVSSQMTGCVYDPNPLSFTMVVPFRPTVATFNILMKACGTDHYRAKALMDEMKIMGLPANHISWSVLIDIYGTSQNMRSAMQAFKTMQDVGVKLDVVAYTTAIKACVENKNLKIAFSLFEEMKRNRLQPNLVTYNTLLRARNSYGSLHEVQQCLAIYQDMRKAGYNSNDYYLKKLLEEWCEGVICCSTENQGLLGLSNSYSNNDREKPHSLLLEKVAIHLQKDVGKNRAIDIRGLTKVEARIVVLSVLRMIKESYWLGKDIKDDLVIISGVGKEMAGAANHEFEVQHAIIKVLQDELGLDVLTGRGAIPARNYSPTPPDVVDNSALLQKTERPKDYKYLARRPQDVGRLKVTRRSLYNWLQKKSRH